MKLYYHPVSTTSRPIVLFATESDIKLDYQVVDLFTGEQYQPQYSAINPSHQVPVLEDGDFRLTERHVRLPLEDAAHGVGHVGGVQACGRDLIEQRLERVVVVPVDDRDAFAGLGQLLANGLEEIGEKLLSGVALAAGRAGEDQVLRIRQTGEQRLIRVLDRRGDLAETCPNI